MRASLVCLVALGLSAFAQIFEIAALDWSPDGSLFLLAAEGQLYRASTPTWTDLQPLYVGMRAEWARFGPDNWFIFASSVEDGFALWRGFPDGRDGREPELLYQSARPISWPTVSADGSKVAFVEEWSELVLLDLGKGEAQVVLGGPWLKATPEFLPAGQALLFAGLWPRGEEPSWEIFYLDLTTRDLIQLTSDSFFDWCPPWIDAFPCWSPEGGEVGYASLRPEGWQFVRVGAY